MNSTKVKVFCYIGYMKKMSFSREQGAYVKRLV